MDEVGNLVQAGYAPQSSAQYAELPIEHQYPPKPDSPDRFEWDDVAEQGAWVASP